MNEVCDFITFIGKMEPSNMSFKEKITGLLCEAVKSVNSYSFLLDSIVDIEVRI